MTTIGGLTLALDILIIILMIALTVTKTREHFIRRAFGSISAPCLAFAKLCVPSLEHCTVCARLRWSEEVHPAWLRHLRLLHCQACG